jgi:hypothetical protein
MDKPPATPMTGTSKLFIAAIGVAVVVLILSAMFNPPQPPVRVSLEALERAFDANEVGAMQRYGSAPLAVTGKVSSISLDSDDDAVISLESIGLLPVHAGIAPSAAMAAGSLSEGQGVTLTCNELTEFMGKPVLDDCTF